MSQVKMVTIPQTVLLSADSLDELEDWLAAQDGRFLDELRRIRKDEDQAGRGKPLSEILDKWPTKCTAGSDVSFGPLIFPRGPSVR
jgi:hypothetical protein